MAGGITSVLMQAPGGWSGAILAQPSGTSYTPDANGFAVVAQADILSLVADGWVVVLWSGKRSNLTATADPGPSNDNSQDYAPGSFWYNSGAGSSGARIFECLSAATGAAVWVMKSQTPHNPRNMLDGGDFGVNPWQRNVPGLASGGVIAAAITNVVTYFPDRWFGVGASTSSILLSQVADTSVAGLSQNCKVQRSSANTDTNALKFGQVLETADSIRAAGQQVTLSFYAKFGANYSGGNLTAQLIAGAGTNQSAASMIAGTWTTQSNVINASQALSATKTRYQFTGTVPAGTTQLGVLFSWTPTGTAGADDSVSFDGIQLEIGASASPFEHRDVQVELELCQRYAWVVAEPAAAVVVGMGALNSTTAAIIYMATPVQMRAAPTVTVSAGTFHAAPAGAVASGTAAAGTTHTPNAITVNVTGITASTAGFGTPFQGGGGTGYIVASAEF